MSDHNDTRGRVGQAVETVVYAPIGLFFEAPTLLPKLVEQGKAHARSARVLGEFAVQQGLQQGRQQLRRRLGGLEQQAGDVLRMFGLGDGAVVDPPPSAARAGPAEREMTVVADRSDGAEHADGAGRAEPSPEVDELAIPDYDSLSASQVVTRLAGLADSELEAVRAYEAAHRRRKTILNKAAQLQGLQG